MAMLLNNEMVVVGLDFGTTYSGFSFARESEPGPIFSFHEYPDSTPDHSKTPTVSYYKRQPGVRDQWRLSSWGFTARKEYMSDLDRRARERRQPEGVDARYRAGPSSEPGHYVTKVKLLLASGRMAEVVTPDQLPAGLSKERVISDYLREFGALILRTLQNQYGPELTNDRIRWRLTVPSIWDNVAKSVMKDCMLNAGLMNGFDHSCFGIVLEPEAAFFHCYDRLHDKAIKVGDKVLIADIGGGTSDIVVEEIAFIGRRSYQVQEVTISTGGLCGGTDVDRSFMKFMDEELSFLNWATEQHPVIYHSLLTEWQHQKNSFSESRRDYSIDIQLHPELLDMMARYLRTSVNIADAYRKEEYSISYDQAKKIFDPVVESIIALISEQLDRVQGVTVIAVVGGFAKSAYLMQRIRQRFSYKVPHIIVPNNPVSAISLGAVMTALNPDTMISRRSRKTYGVKCVEPFEHGVDPDDHLKVQPDGKLVCKNRFHIYVRKNDPVNVNSMYTNRYSPAEKNQRKILLQIFSSDKWDPRYTDELGVRLEGEFWIDISGDMSLDDKRIVKETLYFGRSSIEIVAEGVNFCLGREGSHRMRLPIAEAFM